MHPTPNPELAAVYQRLLGMHMDTLLTHGPDVAAGLALAIGEIHRMHPELGPTEFEELLAGSSIGAQPGMQGKEIPGMHGEHMREEGTPVPTICPNCREAEEPDSKHLHVAPCAYCGSDGHAACQCGEKAHDDALRRADEFEARFGDQRNVHLGGQAWRNLPQYRDGKR